MKVTLSSLPPVFLRAFLLTFNGVLAEENSILIGATLAQFDLDIGYNFSSLAAIDGNYKSLFHNSRVNCCAGKKEVQI